MAIKDLSVNAVLHDEDRFPIYDVESGRTRSVLASTLLKYIDDHPTIDKFVQRGTYSNGTLTLYYNDGGTFDITGFGVGGVQSINGQTGDVTLTADDVGAETERATGTIGQADDPTTKSEGDYYVTEKFVNSPTLPGGASYVGLLRIDDDFDGSNNGGLIAYYTDNGIFIKKRLAAGWESNWQHYQPGVAFSDDGSEVGVFSSVDFKGNGIQLGHANGKLEVTVDTPPSAPTLALHFAGIYDSLQDLQDAIASPSENMQAIVIQPSEKYYHGVGGNWVELAPVGAMHPTYLGTYDTVDDLKAAEPSPASESLAIVGTTAKAFYIYDGAKWDGLTHTDLPALDARVTDVESKTKNNTDRIQVAEGHLQTLQSNDQKHDNEISSIGDDIRQLQGQVYTGNDIEDDSGNSLSDITGLKFVGATVEDPDDDKTATVTVSPKITVANGQQPGSTTAAGNALIFEGATITPDPNDTNVIKVDSPHGGINVGDGVNASREVTTLVFDGFVAYGSGNQANIHLHFKHFKTISERDSWSTKYRDAINFDVLALVDSDSNNFVSWYKWDSATKTWTDYDAQGVIMSDSNGAIPKNIKTVVFGPGFTIQQAGDQEDAALVTYQSSQDDGMTINGKHVSDLEVMTPLQIDSGIGTGGDTRLLVDPRAYEEQHAASCLLQLDSDLTLQAGKASKIYTSHEIIPTGEYYSLNQFAGGVNVQDNTGGDTAVTGGELTRILGSVSFYGKATDNSNVKVWFWYKDPLSPLAGGILNDVNGNPMVVERYYNQGDDMSEPLVVAGAMIATGNAPIVMYVECSAGSYIVNPEQTLICIEQFSDGYETSLASIEFQRRLAIESHAEIKQFKTTMLSLKDELHTDVPEAVVPAHQGYDFINEFGVQNLSDIKASVSSSALNISDNGNVTDFYVDVYIDNVKTTMLRGKTIDYDVVIKNPHDAYYLEVYKWTGNADVAGRIYDSRNNDSIVLNKGFTLLKSKFIAEHPAGDASGVTDSVSIPSDANNIFIILRPGAAQSPISLSLQDFKWGVATPFRGYLETSRVNLREQHLWFSESWAEFGLNAHDLGYAAIRYTINNTPSTGNPMPVGKLYKGKAPVEIDNTVNQVSGSADPQMDGGIKFLKDGEASISKSYNLWNEQGTENTVTFWDVLIDVDGNESKIPDSEKTFRISANTGAPGVVYSIPAYVVEVETGQRVAGRATSNKADGAYVQSQNITQMLVQTEIDFKELVQSGNDDPELINAAIPRAMVFDRRVYTFSGNSQQNIQIPLTIPADVELAEIEVVKHSGTTTTSIKDCEYAYDSSTNTLTVHVGNGVTDGKVYLSFWSGIA